VGARSGANVPSGVVRDGAVDQKKKDHSGLAVINRELNCAGEGIDSPQRVVLDMDSTEIPVHGHQGRSMKPGLSS